MYIPLGKLNPTVFYTSGNEYALATTGISYVGYYHKDTLGGVWTDKEHTLNSISLISYTERNNRPEYINIQGEVSAEYYKISKSNKDNPLSSNLPVSDTLPPTQEDYDKTYTTRYILSYKLTSQPVYIEVNKNTYNNTMNSSDKMYFEGVEVLWKISGPLYDIKQNNILIQGGIIDSNTRSIQQAEQTMSGVSNYLNNLLLYAKPD